MYADGAGEGAPDAVQVADRWHLLANLRQALERYFIRRHNDLPRIEPGAAPEEKPPSTSAKARKQSKREADSEARRTRRRARYDEVKALQKQGLGIRAIARATGKNRTTVMKFAHASEFPEASKRHRTSKLDSYKAYIDRRWQEGCHKGTDLIEEIRVEGYRGSRTVAAEYVTNVSAPGVNIYSSVPGGDFAMYQGTSMATPHVTGASAVLRQLNPKWSPQQVKSALSSTAKRPVWDHVNGTSPITVMHRGAGRIDLSRVGSVPAIFSPASASYGKKIPLVGFTEQRTIIVTNTTKQRQTYAISVEQAVSDPGLKVEVSTTSLTLGAGQSGSVTLTVTASSLVEIGSYEGDVVFATGKGSNVQNLYVPYWVLIDA